MNLKELSPKYNFGQEIWYLEKKWFKKSCIKSAYIYSITVWQEYYNNTNVIMARPKTEILCHGYTLTESSSNRKAYVSQFLVDRFFREDQLFSSKSELIKHIEKL